MRHTFLKEFIGTKAEEDVSMTNSVNALIAFCVCLFICSVLEAVFYFLYNTKVSVNCLVL